MKKLLFLLPLFLFILIPEDTFAATYEYFTLNQVSASGINDDLMLQPIVTTTHYGGRTFYGHAKTGTIGRTRFFLNLSDTSFEIGKKYDINFLMFYTNVTGNTGAVPMVFFENSMCSVVSAGYYNSLKENYNFSGYIHGEDRYGSSAGTFDAWHYTFDNLSVNTTTEYDLSYLFGVKCENVTLDDLSSTTIDVYTGASDSVRATAEYSIQNALAYDLNSNYAVQESIKESTESVKEQTEATKEQTETIKDKDTTEASNEANSFFENFESDDFGLSDVITAPLETIKSVTSKTCNPLNLPLPFVNQNLSLPCIRSLMEEHFGSILTIYQIVTFGLIAYYVCVRIFNLVKDFKNPEHDEIEVMDL